MRLREKHERKIERERERYIGKQKKEKRERERGKIDVTLKVITCHYTISKLSHNIAK